MGDGYVRYERRGAVLIATLTRPDRRNAYDGPGLHAVGALRGVLDGDPDLRVGVVTGAGDDFCAGADIAAAAGGGFDDPPYPEVADGLADKPVIAAIEGVCLGGGMMIATGADLRIAGRSARFGLPEARWNLPTPWLAALARRIAPGHALELALLADEQAPAERLAEMGFLNRVVDDGGALGAALAWAERIAVLAPAALRDSKVLTYAASTQPPDELAEVARRRALELVDMDDTREGAAAFAEGRAPRFTGR
ncbi:MAG: enoyl-CoA hydratase/isomerase family protein [Actinobacteria bacterium]|nr:enoyl-CoA hydratase/isomerase family protein [Actinomycetota bacterium]